MSVTLMTFSMTSKRRRQAAGGMLCCAIALRSNKGKRTTRASGTVQPGLLTSVACVALVLTNPRTKGNKTLNFVIPAKLIACNTNRSHSVENEK